METQPAGDAKVEAPPTGGSSKASSYAITPTPFDTTEKLKADIMWDNGRLFEAQRLVDHFKASEARSPDGSKGWRRSLTKNSRDLEDLTENNRKREKTSMRGSRSARSLARPTRTFQRSQWGRLRRLDQVREHRNVYPVGGDRPERSVLELGNVSFRRCEYHV